MLAVPNITIINTTVASYNNFPNLRLDSAVTVGENENLTRVRDLMLSTVRDDSAYLEEPAPAIMRRSRIARRLGRLPRHKSRTQQFCRSIHGGR